MKKFLLAILIAGSFYSCRNVKEITQSGPPWQMMGQVDMVEINTNALLVDAIKEDMVNNNSRLAISKLQRALKQDPSNATLLFKLGEIYYKTGRIAESVNVLEKAITLAPDNKWNYILLADVYKSRKDYDNAIRVMEQLVQLVPANPFYYQDISNLYLMTGNPQKALKTLDMMEKEFGVGAEISEAKKRIYLAINKPGKAAVELEKLIEAFPGNTDYMRNLVDLYMAMGNKEKVIQLLEKMLEADPNDGEAMLMLADYYFRQGDTLNSHSFARKAFANPYVELEPRMKYLMINYLQKEINEKNVDFVLELSDRLAKDYRGNAQVLAFRGDVYYSMNEDDSALANYTNALKYEKNLVLLWQKVISIQFEKSQFEESKATAHEALDYFPASAIIYLYLGLSENRLKEYDNSVRHFKNGLDFCGDNDKLKLQFYFNLGELYNSLKDYTNSDRYFDKVLEIDPKDQLTLNNYAYYLSLRKENLDKAEMMSKKALENDPGNPAYLDTYGWILYLKGDFDQAAKYVEQALEKKKWDAELLEHLGDIYYRLDRVDEAVELWEKAKKKGSVSPDIDKKIHDKKLYE